MHSGMDLPSNRLPALPLYAPSQARIFGAATFSPDPHEVGDIGLHEVHGRNGKAVEGACDRDAIGADGVNCQTVSNGDLGRKPDVPSNYIMVVASRPGQREPPRL